MATYTWTTALSNFPCSLNDPPTTIVDQIRILIGDKDGKPVAYLSDAQIELIATYHDQDLYTSAAECAQACAGVVLQLYQEIQQGTRFRLKNFEIDKIYKNFMDMANMLRDKSTQGAIPSNGVLSGQIQTVQCTRSFTPGYRSR